MEAMTNFALPAKPALPPRESSSKDPGKTGNPGSSDFRNTLKDSIDRAEEKNDAREGAAAKDRTENKKEPEDASQKDNINNKPAVTEEDEAIKTEAETVPVQTPAQSILAQLMLAAALAAGAGENNAVLLNQQTTQPAVSESSTVKAAAQNAALAAQNAAQAVPAQGKTGESPNLQTLTAMAGADKKGTDAEKTAETKPSTIVETAKPVISKVTEGQQKNAADTGGTDKGKNFSETAKAAAPVQTSNKAETLVSNSEKTAAENAKTTVKESDADAKPTESIPVTVKAESLDPAKVNIKVAENAKADVPQQIAEKIIFNAKEGKQEFDIQLNPRELGKISIKLVVENGSAQVLLQCSNPKTQNMLMANSEALRSIVEGNTGLHTTVNVQDDGKGMDYQQQKEAFDGKEQGQNKHHQQQSQQRMSEEETTAFINQLKFGLVQQYNT